ncbi:toll/interleukin-1 receptor domain-containing protein [Bradyrhizobium sp. SZCCHNS3052]|uniref:toll/interleukin-1 receptor domain-containing protein n=1 Tax=Bradyrhizobium sp. SZCCHNS3052 TaxID=3057321 RepID=UPI002916EC8E|nr:toll/interleukin-1 receptor domain-containing protein [Bradyrhizobium sp. SZCCHNS3052]
MRIFISFASRDRELVRQLDTRLRLHRPDISCFLDERGLTGGVYWMPSLAKELAEADVVLLMLGQSIGQWQELEYYEALQLSRQTEREGRPRIIPVVIADRPAPGLAFLSTLHQIFAPHLPDDAAFAAIESALDAAPSSDDWEPWRRFQPYKGLPALTETDADFFFGREKETADILDLLSSASRRAVVLIGQSGVGKSSLVLAGVLSRLKSQLPPLGEKSWPEALRDSRSYLHVSMRPGREPVKELAASFVKLYGTSAPAIEKEAKEWVKQFQTGSQLRDMLRLTRDRIAEEHGGVQPKRFVLYVDQGEENYTRAPADEARLFSKLLIDAAEDDSFTVLLSLRSDFYSDFQNDALFDVSERFDVRPLGRDVLVDVIRKPAETLGARFEDQKIPALIAGATQREAGTLPLLSDLLQEMWLNMLDRGDGVLRWSDQPGIIDISLPLKRRADAFVAVARTNETAIQRLFTLRLAQVFPAGEAVRRRARKSECSPEEWSLAERLSGPDQRLLTISTPTLGGEPVVEVAHEQLLQRWPRLKEWLDEQRKFLIWRTEVEQEAKIYAELPDEQKPAQLLMGLRLTTAQQWLSSRRDDLGSELLSYVDTSIERQEREDADKLSTLNRLKDAELEVERRRANDARKNEQLARKVAANARRLTGVAFTLLLILAFIVIVTPFVGSIRPLLPKTAEALLTPQLPEALPTSEAYWLDQNWSNEERHWFHHAQLGAATFPIAYSWFMAMEQPNFSLFGTPGLISDSTYLERFGFIPSPRSVDGDPRALRSFGYAATTVAKIDIAPMLPAGLKPTPAGNEGGLPVGFARLSGVTDPATGAAQSDKIGLTCAACHTGSIHYKGVSVRFDGGPGMVDLRKLEEAMGFAMIFTQYVPGRFSRFADRVLGPNATDADRDALKKGLKAATDFALNMQAKNYQTAIEAKGQTETEEGFGRLDALNRIGNQVFYLDMAASGMTNMLGNQEAIDAPVSYPPIWTVPWFSWAQYDGSISQPLIRDAGEVLGVSTQIIFSPETASDKLWRSSMAIENLVHIEDMLRGPDPFATTTPAFGGLASPKWPEKLFAGDDAWKIDPARVERGRKLYAAVCVECHLGPVADPVFDKTYPDKSFWKIKSADDWESKGWNATGPILDLVQKPVEAMQTDPGQANIFAVRKVKVPGFLGLDPAKDLKGCNLPQGSTTEMPYALALMAVVQKASDKWMEDRKLSPVEQATLWGDRRNCPNPAGKSYRARPLNGVWATAPYLHNGSVPSLYWMLTPAAERPTSFCQGARDYDPKHVGFDVPKGGETSCKVGQSLFAAKDTNGKPIKGNSTLGHSFEGPTKPNKDYPNGIIGGAFPEEERWDIIEYLKTL